MKGVNFFLFNLRVSLRTVARCVVNDVGEFTLARIVSTNVCNLDEFDEVSHQFGLEPDTLTQHLTFCMTELSSTSC